MNVSTLQELSIQTIYNLCLNCQNQLDARDILAKLTSPVLAEISEFLLFFYRFWDAFTFYTYDIFLLCEEILQQMANVSSPFFQLCNKCCLSNPTRNTKRVILKYAIILCHNIFSPKPTGILLMNNVIQDKHKQRDIVIHCMKKLF
jgi:hypothetical protein